MMRFALVILLVAASGCGRVADDPSTDSRSAAIEACPANTVEWPMERRCAGRGSWTAAIGPTTPTPVWNGAQPGAVEHIVIAPNGNPITISNRSKVVAQDKRDGTVLWSVDLDASRLAVGATGTTYVTTTHDVMAIDPSGVVRWTVPASSDQKAWPSRFLLLDDESVVVTTWSEPVTRVRRIDSAGKIQWTVDLEGPMNHDLAADRTSLYVSDAFGFQLVDLVTGAVSPGAQIRSEDEGSVEAPSLSVAGPRVLVASELGSFSVARAGTLKWANYDGIPAPRSFAVDSRGFAFGTITSEEPSLAAYDHVAFRSDGSVAWRIPANVEDTVTGPAPIVDVTGDVYFFYGRVLSIVTSTGDLLFQQPMEVYAAAMSDDGTLYIGGEAGLTALR